MAIMRTLFFRILFLALLSTVPLNQSFAGEAEWEALTQRLMALYQQGRYEEATRYAERALAEAEATFGNKGVNTATSLNGLAVLYDAQGRHAEAEPLHRRALAIWEQALGLDHPAVAASLNNLAVLYQKQGRYAEAEPRFRRALAIFEQALGPDHPNVAGNLHNLADLYRVQGRTAEAEPLHRRALAISEQALGPDHPDVARGLNNLADLYRAQGRYAEAEPLHRRALAISEQALGPDHPAVAASLNNLAGLYDAQGRYAEAEPLQRRALAINEQALGPDHPDVARGLNNLALLYHIQGRYAEAEPCFWRALAIFKQALGPDHSAVANSLNNLAVLYDAQGRYAEAEPLHRRALAIWEQTLGPAHPALARGLSSLAELYRAQGRTAEAEPLQRRALAIREQTLGPHHPDVAGSLNNLALLYHIQGRTAEAEPLYRRALAIREQALGPHHPDVAGSLNNLAALYQIQSRYAEAKPLYQRAVSISERAEVPIDLLRFSRNLGFFFAERNRLNKAIPYYRQALDTLDRLFANTRGLPEDVRQTFVSQYEYVYREFIDLLLELHQQDSKAGYDREALAVASRNQSRIFSELLRQADVGKFAAEPAFQQLKKQRETLFVQAFTLREQRATIPVSDANAEVRKNALSQQIDQAEKELAQVEQRLWKEYPRFMELTAPRPVTVEQLQKELLKPREAILSFVLLKDQTVLFAVTRERFAMKVADLPRAEVLQLVHAARQGLQDPSQALEPALLHTLYQQLIAPLEDALKEAERIIVVADGSLYNLPLELLVTRYGETERQTFIRTRRAADGSSTKPRLGEYAGLPYLGDRYRFSYLPSLAALVSQRKYPKSSVPMTRQLVAFADPIFGPEARPDSAKTPSRGYSDATTKGLQLLTRSIGVEGPSLLPRLPETAEEATTIARLLGDKNPLYLREKAQERTAKTLDLTGVRYLLFSTHGLLGGEFLQVVEEPKKPEFLSTDRPVRRAPDRERAQPALALTLVGDLQGEDGFLTMKEVIEDLNLNTDLVVLSACNTAGETDATLTGEGFVGMTRAFLYAGARQLVVSHWNVESAATRDLITALFQNLQKQPLAQALPAATAQLRGSSVKLDPKTAPKGIAVTSAKSGQYVSRAHPFFWAPFVVVGD